MNALLELTYHELKEEMAVLGEKSFRAEQIYGWLTACRPFEEMGNLPAALRQRLREEYREGYLEQAEKRVSRDGTVKYLLRLADGNLIESVVMSYSYGRTACLSTQAGCGMGCAFCASAVGGLVRNLSAGELLAQTLCLNADLGSGRNLTNLVLMGTGEPLANYDNVVRFLRMVNDQRSLNISFRNISLSTCGVVPGILRLAEEGLPMTLCLSLHSAIEEKRRAIMPIAERYSIEETVDALRIYHEKTGRRIIFEYILIRGFNDGEADAAALAGCARGLNCHVNLIPMNNVKGKPFAAPDRQEAARFLRRLETLGLSATIRRTLGQDIEGACGQLRARHIR